MLCSFLPAGKNSLREENHSYPAPNHAALSSNVLKESNILQQIAIEEYIIFVLIFCRV